MSFFSFFFVGRWIWQFVTPVAERRSAMCDVYRVSSSGRVEQMEAELSQQLSALQAEIEENGFPRKEAPSRCYRCGSCKWLI